jgi:hypothetical protein
METLPRRTTCMTRTDRITLAACIAFALAWTVSGIIPREAPETRLPMEWAHIYATWAGGRVTESFRVGDGYYAVDGTISEEDPGAMANRHAGTPERWRYIHEALCAKMKRPS